MKIEIDKDTPLSAGDVVEMHFRIYGGIDWTYFRAIQVAAIQSRLRAQRPELEVIRDSFVDDFYVITFRVKRPDELPGDVVYEAGLTGVIIAVAVVGISLFTFLSFDRIYKITDSPAGKIALVGTGAVGIGLLVLVVLLAVSKAK